MKLKKQKGFTLFELVGVVAAFAILAGLLGLGYAAVHFISKIW